MLSRLLYSEITTFFLGVLIMLKSKNIIAVLICLVFVFQVSAFAYEGSDADVADDPSRYQTVCGNNAYHHMVSHCWGSARLPDNTVYINSGCVWQCSNCYLIMVTEGDIILNQMQTIGKWGTYADIEPLSSMVTVVYVSSWGYCSSNSMSGYQFFTA